MGARSLEVHTSHRARYRTFTTPSGGGARPLGGRTGSDKCNILTPHSPKLPLRCLPCYALGCARREAAVLDSSKLGAELMI